MTIAVMQPYIFPYLGYFQLVHAVDLFVFYDDVNFIKQGWINRNRILINGDPSIFTIPVQQISSFQEIKDVRIPQEMYLRWRQKFLRSLEMAYRKAPFFAETMDVILAILKYNGNRIADLAELSVREICNYVGCKTQFVNASAMFEETKALERTERLIAICVKNNADHYINPVGGMALYDKALFGTYGIKLEFIKTVESVSYCQSYCKEFIPSLSIIDVLMFNNVSETKKLLLKYELL